MEIEVSPEFHELFLSLFVKIKVSSKYHFEINGSPELLFG